MSVRTRFAPSPTGMLHIGNARTALFNWLLARHHGGTLVLRVEDTDRERSTDENTRIILDSLAWLGIQFDEGPYFQSERTDLYRAAIDRLIADGHAYRCTCTAEELEAKREQAKAEKRTYLYDRACREAGHGPDTTHVVRLAMPTTGSTVLEDRIMGRVEVQNAELDDWIIARSDGSPTYNFCVVVDDADMRITHVVRGADHLINTHKQLNLYAALGFTPPEFGHMALTLGPDRAKLSKRHGAAAVLEYRDMGYLPQAMRNFLVRLGWAHGDQEIFTDDELIAVFDLAGVGNTNAIFDIEKLNWINSVKIRDSKPPDLVEPLRPHLAARGYPADDPRLSDIIAQLQERSKTLVDMAERAAIFYQAPAAYDEKAVKKWWHPGAAGVLELIAGWIESQPHIDPGTVMPFLEGLVETTGLKIGQIAQPLRIALTGSSASPPIDITLALIGKDEALLRVRRAVDALAGSTEK